MICNAMVSVIWNFFEQKFRQWVLEKGSIHSRLSQDLLKTLIDIFNQILINHIKVNLRGS